MAELMDTLRNQIDASTLDGLSRRVGSDSGTVRKVIGMVIPMLIAGLSKNVHDSPDGRASLNRALEQDHDGSLLDQLGSLLGGSGGAAGRGGLGGLADTVGDLFGGARGTSTSNATPGGTTAPARAAKRATDGDGILQHVLGSRRHAVEEGAARASGMDPDQVSSLLGMLAPLVMGALGRMKKEGDLGPDEIAEVVDRERRSFEQATPDAQEGDLRHLLDGPRGSDDLASMVGRLGDSIGGSLLSSRDGKP